MNTLGNIGQMTMNFGRELSYQTAVICRVLVMALNPARWPRTVRSVLALQIYFTAVGALGFVGFLSLLVGVGVVVQAQLWLRELGQSTLIGPLLIMVVVRELAPLLVNIVVIVRSGSAVSVELGNMSVHGEVRVLEAQGVEPFSYLVLPRVLGMAISVACLTILFIVVSVGGGYLCALLIDTKPPPFAQFMIDLFNASTPKSMIATAAKAVLPALATGAICSTEGLAARGPVTIVPVVTRRAMTRSVAALFTISVLITVLSYL
ncbi:MAG: hypothetical protein GC162_11540 [Planctomycetes bacterium]|nr:hypothetical protein [Planctomycetota bacterium]